MPLTLLTSTMSQGTLKKLPANSQMLSANIVALACWGPHLDIILWTSFPGGTFSVPTLTSPIFSSRGTYLAGFPFFKNSCVTVVLYLGSCHFKLLENGSHFCIQYFGVKTCIYGAIYKCHLFYIFCTAVYEWCFTSWFHMGRHHPISLALYEQRLKHHFLHINHVPSQTHSHTCL